MTTEVINSKRMKDKTKRKKKPKRNIKKENRDLLFIVISLYIIGLVFILSSSSANLVVKNEDPFYFVKKQLLFGAISIIPFCMAYFINIKNIVKQHKLIFLLSIGILLVVLFFGKEVKGNRNWLDMGIMSVQPSEFVKIALIICSSVYLKSEIIDKTILKKVLFVICILLGLVVVQGDLGTVIIMGAISLFVLFISGTSLKFLGFICLVAFAGLGAAIIMAPFRMKRMAIFLNPFQDYYGMGYQIIQSLYSVANGGFLGRGIYESVQKYGFLPENHTDFIFSIIVEEVGLVGAIILLALFILLITKIFKIAYCLKEKEYALIVSGIGCLIAIEALMNLGVTVSLLPVAGVTLPFVSYGGSSFMSKITAIAIILNINKNCEKIEENEMIKRIKEEAEYRKYKKKKIKKHIKSVKDGTIAKIKTFEFKRKEKKDKVVYVNKKFNLKLQKKSYLNREERESEMNNMNNINNMNNKNSLFDLNKISKISTITKLNNINKRIQKENSPKFDIPNIKFDVKNIINNATSTKTKVVKIKNTSGLREIKIKKKRGIFTLNKNIINDNKNAKINK